MKTKFLIFSILLTAISASSMALRGIQPPILNPVCDINRTFNLKVNRPVNYENKTLIHTTVLSDKVSTRISKENVLEHCKAFIDYQTSFANETRLLGNNLSGRPDGYMHPSGIYLFYKVNTCDSFPIKEKNSKDCVILLINNEDEEFIFGPIENDIYPTCTRINPGIYVPGFNRCTIYSTGYTVEVYGEFGFDYHSSVSGSHRLREVTIDGLRFIGVTGSIYSVPKELKEVANEHMSLYK